MKRWFIIFILSVFLFTMSCVTEKEYPPTKYKKGDIVCFVLNKNIKGIILKACKENDYKQEYYKIRYISSTEKTNTRLLSPDDKIDKQKFALDSFFPFEICDCENNYRKET